MVSLEGIHCKLIALNFNFNELMNYMNSLINANGDSVRPGRGLRLSFGLSGTNAVDNRL